MTLRFLMGALESPPPEILWLGVIPISIAIGKWVGDILDLAIGPLAEGAEWSKLGSVAGGLFGFSFYITVIVVA
jgi:hypothetical protein